MQHTDETAKKSWNKPELVTYGSIEDLTADQGKTFGLNDGFFLIVPTNTLRNLGS